MESKNPTRRRFTPEKIEELDEYGVFVFGSNLNGDHAGGAARTAVDKFGAVMGQAEGLQGQSYAIPTLDEKMQRLPIERIRASVETLYRFAEERPELDFFVTRIGCGIAGFEESEIARIFKSFEFTPFNVILPMEFTTIRGVKGFGKGMVCSGTGYRKQYRENTEFVEDTAQACERGMHFVENPLEVFKYYAPNKDGETSEYATVTGSGIVDSDKDDSKIAVSHLSVGARLSLMDIWKMGLEFTWKKSSFLFDRLSRRKVKNGKSAQDYSTLAARDGSTLASQDYSTLAAQDSSTLAAKDSSTLAAQDYSTLAARNWSTLAAQDGNVIACRHNGRVEMFGTGNIAVGANGTRMRGKVGNAICLVEMDGRNRIVAVKAAIIDGKILKEDVFYTLKNGEFTEVE